MMNFIDESQIMVIADNNQNQLPTIVAIFVAVYIIFALIKMNYNKKRLKKLKRIKELITFRHEQIVSDQERREKFAQSKKINGGRRY